MLSSALSRGDALLGAGIERAVGAHHRRRLARAGRLDQLHPAEDGRLWVASDPPPRPGCEWEILIDGEQALEAIAAEIAGARESVDIAGWHITPAFGLTRGTDAAPLRELLADAATRARVRVLLWAGSPAPVFKPTRSAVAGARAELTRDSGVRCALDKHERPMHCHHEKLVIVDGRTAFVGGIDLTSLGGDRWDRSGHPYRDSLGWHDVASRVRGPAVGDVAAHFATRWQAVTGEPSPPAAAAAEPPRGDGVEVQLVRTVPEKIYPAVPHGDFRILEAYTRALRSARSLVYLESQFLWSPHLVSILAGKLRDPPSEDFRVVVLLPVRPNNGADTTRGQLGVLAEADDGRGRFLATTLVSRTARLSGQVYVHAKVGIVDDRWLMVGSANLNEHSFFNDTEVGLIACNPELARDTRLRLWAEHLEAEPHEIDGPPARVIDERWRPIAAEQLARAQRGEPHTHHLMALAGVSRRSAALLGPLQSLLVDG